jgi:hypothetical protein
MKNATAILNAIFYNDITNIIIEYIMISKSQVRSNKNAVNYTIRAIRNSYKIFDLDLSNNFIELYFDLRMCRRKYYKRRRDKDHAELVLSKYYKVTRQRRGR